MSHPKNFTGDVYAPLVWKSAKRYYKLSKNGFGQWWPELHVKIENGGYCYINIRDSNPFKSFKGAVTFVEKLIEEDKAKGHVFGTPETQRLEQIQSDAKSGKTISIMDLMDAQKAVKDAQKAASVAVAEPETVETVEPIEDFTETPIPLDIVEPETEAEITEADITAARAALCASYPLAVRESSLATVEPDFQPITVIDLDTVEPIEVEPIEVEPVTEQAAAVPSMSTDFLAGIYAQFAAKQAAKNAPKPEKQPRQKREPKPKKEGKNCTVESLYFGLSHTTYTNGRVTLATAADCLGYVKMGSNMQQLIEAIEESPKSIDELCQLLGWQLHSTRTLLTDKMRRLGYGFSMDESGRYSLIMPEGATHKIK